MSYLDSLLRRALGGAAVAAPVRRNPFTELPGDGLDGWGEVVDHQLAAPATPPASPTVASRPTPPPAPAAPAPATSTPPAPATPVTAAPRRSPPAPTAAPPPRDPAGPTLAPPAPARPPAVDARPAPAAPTSPAPPASSPPTQVQHHTRTVVQQQIIERQPPSRPATPPVLAPAPRPVLQPRPRAEPPPAPPPAAARPAPVQVHIGRIVVTGPKPKSARARPVPSRAEPISLAEHLARRDGRKS